MLTLTVDTAWGARPHHIEPVRTIADAAPCYMVRIAPAGDPSEDIMPVADYRRFGFYQGDWWRIVEDREDWAGPDLLSVDPIWGLRNHYSIAPTRRYAGANLMPALKLIICDANDPRRFGRYRNSTWRIEGDE